MNVLQPLFQLLYFIAHFLVSLLQSAYNTYCDVQQIARRILLKFYSNTYADGEQLRKWCSTLPKLPAHIALIIQPGYYQSSQLQDLCRVLTLFVYARTSYITAYDANGVLYDEKSLIFKELQKQLPSTVQLNLTETKEQPESPAEDKKQVYLNIQSYEAGTRAIMSCVRDLGESSGNLDLLGVSDVHALITAHHYKHTIVKRKANLPQSDVGDMPDPELVVVIGDHLSSCGFPCWFLRLSEFVLTPSLFRLDKSEMLRILGVYAGMEQRYGR